MTITESVLSELTEGNQPYHEKILLNKELQL